MTRISGMGLIAAVVLLVAQGPVLARNHTGARPPGASRAAIAPSSGPALKHRKSGTTAGPTALGSGDAAPAPQPNADAAVQAENELLDRKLKSICRGC